MLVPEADFKESRASRIQALKCQIRPKLSLQPEKSTISEETTSSSSG